MQILRRIRLFCDVPRKAVERATGVSEHRLAKFEAGRIPLHDVEEQAVVSFLRTTEDDRGGRARHPGQYGRANQPAEFAPGACNKKFLYRKNRGLAVSGRAPDC